MKRINVDKSSYLRKNQTDAERKLWSALRNKALRGVKFRRQFQIEGYILDFYSPEYKLGIEADGGQHYSSDKSNYDAKRTERLSKKGIKILRFSDRDILMYLESVKNAIYDALQNPPSSSPSPLRVEGIKTFTSPEGERIKVRGDVKTK